MSPELDMKAVRLLTRPSNHYVYATFRPAADEVMFCVGGVPSERLSIFCMIRSASEIASALHYQGPHACPRLESPSDV